MKYGCGHRVTFAQFFSLDLFAAQAQSFSLNLYRHIFFFRFLHREANHVENDARSWIITSFWVWSLRHAIRMWENSEKWQLLGKIQAWFMMGSVLLTHDFDVKQIQEGCSNTLFEWKMACLITKSRKQQNTSLYHSSTVLFICVDKNKIDFTS